MTNLTPEEFSAADLKEVYRLLWGIETAYNALKKKMKLGRIQRHPGTADPTGYLLQCVVVQPDNASPD